ncbi:hypothetical protein K438DRAFT_1884919 [Mycena galopus ATCC 62051]|nr:hypothetical protein K438DRAFT_1884919 [Mycena galopus ATCC 62051]
MSSAISESIWTLVFSEITKSATALFFNGICILLALQGCYFLSRRTSSGRGVLVWAMIIACAFSILHMSYQVAFTAMFVRLLRAAGIAATASEQQDLQASFRHLSQTKLQWDNIVILINNFAADSLFIYRCYAIWGQSRYKGRIILVPLLLLLFTTVFGIVVNVLQSAEDGHLVVALGAITTNIVLTGLTTGRIWWTRHHLHLQVVGEKKLIQRYNTAIAMLLESSALYLVLILTILFTETLGGAAAFESTIISMVRRASG